MIPATIVVATSNTHKVVELQQLAQHHGIQSTLVAWNDVGTPYDIEETGHTFEENAYIKAIAVYEQTGLPVIADDSGLEVDALCGSPGIRSARYAGDDASNQDNRAKLLSELTDRRTAAFRCVLCYTDGQRTVFGEGSVKGLIATAECGDNGFGYDSLFVPEYETRTFAEMTPEEKQKHSHRSRAFSSLVMNMQSPMSSPPPQSMFLIQAAIAAAINNEPLLRSATRQALASGVAVPPSQDDARRVYEAVLQTYLFAGYPAALDGLVVVAEECKSILGETIEHHVEAFDVEVFRERGTVLCRMIYGNVYDKLMARLDEVSPDLREWLIVEGYGKTLSRLGLDAVTRELCVVGVLAATGRTTQLYSHVRGALFVGASVDDFAQCIDVVTECVSARNADAIRSVLKSISV